MTLEEECIRMGNRLFRWRSYLPLIFMVLIIINMKNFEFIGKDEKINELWQMGCFLIAILGLAIRAFTVGYVPNGTSGRNTKEQIADSLNTTGIYSITRNPLYLGNFFIYLSVVGFVHSAWLTMVYLLTFFFYYERIIFAEESFLKNKFGDKYLFWVNQNSIFFPRFKNWEPPSLPFSFKMVLKQEYLGWFYVILAFTLLELIGDFVAKGSLQLDLTWVVLFLSGLFLYCVLTFVKKKTNLLSTKD